MTNSILNKDAERYPNGKIKYDQDNVAHIYAQVTLPEEFSDKYTAEDKAALQKVVDWMNAGAVHPAGHGDQRTKSKLARAIGKDDSTVNLVMNGKYTSPPGKILAKLLEVVERDERRHRQIQQLPFVETSVSRLVYSVCHRTHLYRDMGLIAGKPGTGKTQGLKRYAEEVDSAVFIQCTTSMPVSLLLDELVELTGATVRTAKRDSRGTQAQRLHAVIEALKGTDNLLIIDEADLMPANNLEHLRRISDLANVGVVLAGEPRLHYLVSPTQGKDGRFERIADRISFWAPVIQAITKDDAIAMTQAAHAADGIEADEAVLDAYWQVSEGSARVLSKLIPNVRDFGIRQGHELTPDLIYKIAQTTMRQTRQRKPAQGTIKGGAK